MTPEQCLEKAEKWMDYADKSEVWQNALDALKIADSYMKLAQIRSRIDNHVEC